MFFYFKTMKNNRMFLGLLKNYQKVNFFMRNITNIVIFLILLYLYFY